MLDDMTQMIKEKLLQDLIDKMSDAGGDRMKPKGLGVEVQAPDAAHLADGLDKAKDLLGKGALPTGGDDEMPMPGDGKDGGDEEDDEHRLLQLLENDDEDDKGR